MFVIEGNIGAGKSTFLRLVAQKMQTCKTISEPKNDWQQTIYGQSLLTNFYEKSQRWAYTFELLTLICRVQNHIKEQTDSRPLKIIERSVYSGYYCFAHNSFSQEFMSPAEWELYQEWFAFLVPHQCIPPQGFIYLRVTPEIAYSRIKKRNRHAEKTMSLAYLKQIHQRHETFLIKKEGILPHLKKVPVLILDCDEEFENDSYQFHRHMHALQKFIMQIEAHTPAFVEHAHHAS